jgi:hypothetical protein
MVIQFLCARLIRRNSILDTAQIAIDTWQPSMKKSQKQVIREFLQKAGSKGGKARAAKYDKGMLSKWARKGGKPKHRPTRKKATQK